ncbi:hypothetical protein ACFRCG_17790, partial [Embleya sp. NPDC056575]
GCTLAGAALVKMARWRSLPVEVRCCLSVGAVASGVAAGGASFGSGCTLAGAALVKMARWRSLPVEVRCCLSVGAVGSGVAAGGARVSVWDAPSTAGTRRWWSLRGAVWRWPHVRVGALCFRSALAGMLPCRPWLCAS